MVKFIRILALAVCVGLSACVPVMADRAFERMKEDLRNSDVVLDGDFLSDNDGFRRCELYRFLEEMPKGSDLHLHNGVMMPVDELLEHIRRTPELSICTKADSLGYVKIMKDGVAPEGYASVDEALASGLTLSDFRDALTLRSRPDSVREWDYFSHLFKTKGELFKGYDLMEKYFVSAFSAYARRGVWHLEPRFTFRKGYKEASEFANTIRRAQDKVREAFPAFSVSIIFCGLKNPGFEGMSEIIFENALFVHDNVKDTLRGCSDMVVGFDFAQEEDKSYPLSSFGGLTRKTKAAKPTLRMTFHAGESLNPDNDEIRTAINLGASRIGHGYNLYMHPELIPVMRRKKICIESCPISNNTLGYNSDLFAHPVKDYIRKGIPVALCDDDPQFQEGRPLVDDFFVAAAYWDLSLGEIRNICRNSIHYSFLPNDMKRDLLKYWRKEWRGYIKRLTSFTLSVQ